MLRQTALILAAVLLLTPLSPARALAWRCQPAGPYYQGGYSHDYYDNYDDDCDDYYYDEDYNRYYDDDDDDVGEALLWGLGGLLLGGLLLSATATTQDLPAEPEVISQPPSQVYGYPPPVPPGMCRWERSVLDAYGRNILDQYGQPVKEYTLGACQFPPN